MEGSQNVSTLDYAETPYEDASYEVVGEPPSDEVFVPLKVSVVRPHGEALDDFMFADFGGKVTTHQDVLWHLPEQVRYVSEEKQEEAKDEAQEEERRLAEMLEAARQAGVEEGKAQAQDELLAAYNEKLTSIQTSVQTVLKDLHTQLKEQLRLIERRAVKLSMDITEKLVPHAVEINPEYIVSILKEGLPLASTAVIKRIRVSPADLEFIDVVGVREMLAEFEGGWEFTADDTIRAGCVIETSAGEVVFDLDVAWTRVKENVARLIK